MGETLCALRAKAVLAGMRVLSEEEILEEIKRRRGRAGRKMKRTYIDANVLIAAFQGEE